MKSILKSGAIFLFSAGSFLASPAADEPANLFPDQVGTLALSQELDCRGSLGGVTVDRLGFIYVANFRDKVWRIDPEGQVELVSKDLYGASGNAIDSRGRLYQAEFTGNAITRFDRDGTASTFASGGLQGPVGIAIDGEDNLFVCNCNGNSLSRIRPDGTVEPFAESDLFACPNGLTFDEQGLLYVTNFNNHQILRVSESGEVEVFATIPGGAGNAHIAYAKGFFYITKIMSNRIMKLSLAGDVFPVAGTGKPGHNDGLAGEATFHSPNGIALSPRGDLLYINTLVGEFRKPAPATLTIRTIELTSLGKVFREALTGGTLDDAVAAYRSYKADPVRGQEHTVAEMVAVGYSYLSARRIPEAIQVFQLNAGSYPEDPTAQYQLGEAYRYIGRTEEAVAQYRKVLALNPEDQRASSRLVQLEAAPG